MHAPMRRAQIVQNCYVVRNLEEGCERLHRLYGIGPFVGGTQAELGDHFHRGRPAPPIVLRGVFVQSGELNIELVELVSTTPSAFHDMYANGRQGLHHVAMFCADYAAERDAFVAAGYPVASEFSVSFGAQICYIDAREYARSHDRALPRECDHPRHVPAGARCGAELGPQGTDHSVAPGSAALTSGGFTRRSSCARAATCAGADWPATTGALRKDRRRSGTSGSRAGSGRPASRP